jgi:PTS system mannose-specific IID component
VKELPRVLKVRLFARSLLLQSCWSYERMQGLGFAFNIEPFVGAEAARKRHLEFFNTQPFVEPLVLGMACAMEEEAARAPEAERAARYARLRALKAGAASSLAGLADSLFWGSLRPACAGLAWLAGLVVARTLGPMHGAAAAVLVYLIAYNVPALWTRWKGLQLGYAWGERIAIELRSLRPQALIRKTALAGGVATLGCAAMLLWSEPRPLLSALSLAAFLILKFEAARLYGGACAAGILASAAGFL